MPSDYGSLDMRGNFLRRNVRFSRYKIKFKKSAERKKKKELNTLLFRDMK